ncbi:MAG: glycosyltransferase family 2 protein [Chitinophagaceae bacterium]|jgi:glycosyltransferase involved in cell wall biosynthesis|nr:glycosyltransferase family 2 protein [Chitinophagaceae bacterium]
MQKNNPLVSIAMATYNGAKYIEEQLQSIIQQTYSNLEIVIVDDCSKDNTVETIEHYQEQYPFIRLYINEQNSGVTKTFETAIQECSGEFIAISDQDDIWELNKIEILVNEIGEHDAVYSNSLLVDASGQSLNKSFTTIMNMKTYYSGAPFLLSNSVPGHTILMKQEFVQNILPFPPKMLFDLWIGFCAAGNNGIKFVDKTLVKYRQHETNTIGTRDSKNKKKKESIQTQFEFKLNELKTLATAPIKDERTKLILHKMIEHFHQKWSFKRSAFFFKYYNDILVSKKKPTFRKKLFCMKMFFKPNY